MPSRETAAVFDIDQLLQTHVHSLLSGSKSSCSNKHNTRIATITQETEHQGLINVGCQTLKDIMVLIGFDIQ